MYRSTWNFLVKDNISLPQQRMTSTKNLRTLFHFTNKNVSQSSAVILSNIQEAPDSWEIKQILEWQRVNIGFICKIEGLAGHKLVNNRPIKSEKHWLKVPTNQFEQPTDPGIPKTIIQPSRIRDFASNLIMDYSCCRPYQKKTVRRANFPWHITWMQDRKLDMYVFCNRMMLDICACLR